MVYYATYSTLVQESVAKLHKMLLGLFGIEILKQVSVEVTQLKETETDQCTNVL